MDLTGILSYLKGKVYFVALIAVIETEAIIKLADYEAEDVETLNIDLAIDKEQLAIEAKFSWAGIILCLGKKWLK